VVAGAGYSFRAPSNWPVVRSAREVRVSEGRDGAALVGVSRLALRSAFRPTLWAKAVHELDGASAAIARQQHGSVRGAENVTISGQKARRYRVAYVVGGKKLVEELVFVLRGKTEYLLLCRYEQGASHEACDRLRASFTLM
jgi:hypothetical protein